MNRLKLVPLFFFLFFASVVYAETSEERDFQKLKLCIQPIGTYDPSLVKYLVAGIQIFLHLEVWVNNPISIKDTALIEVDGEQSVYSSLDTLYQLKGRTSELCELVVGLTSVDLYQEVTDAEIITSRVITDDYVYRNVIGNAYINGSVAIVSDYFFQSKDSLDAKKALVSVTVHEIIHLAGVRNYKDPDQSHCIMSEKKSDKDFETVFFCDQTRKYLSDSYGMILPQNPESLWSVIFPKGQIYNGFSQK